jgi:Na+/H+ antiporter NhaD/arsenite permease-like protein
VTSGIFININLKPTPKNNILFLIFGAIISNFIGTTGASMLLIRPFLKMNEKKLKAYHVVFFIFIISNIGGALTPIGDPPLFIGFLKGIPFFWTLIHNFFPWLFALTLLCCAFYYYDSKNQGDIDFQKHEDRSIIELQGHRNIFFVLAIILSVFINPIVFPNLPTISYHGHEISFIREVLFLLITVIAYFFANKKVLEKNNFTWEPIKELSILFLGIFITMTPVLSLLTTKIQGVDPAEITTSSLFWGTGIMSSFLDNAPTYLNFLTISMSSLLLDVGNVQDVITYASGNVSNSINELRAISIGAVFFGAMTYIGNGPNLMVKAIAEKKVKMPTFFEYITKFSFKVLLPIVFICWLIFCR